MSWRASPPAPAPPVTSTSSHSLFGATSSAPTNRTISSRSSSAASHLARQMSVMDDDAASIKSRRSTMTLNGNGNGKQRSRTASFASVASKSTVKGTSRSDDVEMETGPTRGTPSPPAPTLGVPTASTSAATPRPTEAAISQVVKRQKLEGTPAAELGRRSSWFGTGNWRGGATATETAPSMSPALSGDATGSTSAPTSPSRIRSTTAPATTSSSLSYMKPVPPAPSAPATPTPSSEPPSSIPFPLITTPVPLESVGAPLTRRTSWFSLTSGTGPGDRPHVHSPRPVSVVLDKIPDAVDQPLASSLKSNSSERSQFLEVPGLGSVEAGEREMERIREEEERERTKAADQATITPAQGRGWLSLLSLSSLTTTAQVAPAPAVDTEEDGTKTPPSTSFETQHDTIKAAPPPTDDDAATPTPSPRLHATRIADQRVSWWGWAGYPDAPSPVVEPVVEEVVVVLEPEPVAVEATPSVTSSTSTEPRSKTWLRTIWGEFPKEAATRTAKEMQEEELAGQASALAITTPKAPVDASVSLPPSVSSSPALPPAAHLLKHKASWGFFPSRASSIIAPGDAAVAGPSTAPIPSLDLGRPLSSTKPVTVSTKPPISKNLNAVASSASSRTSSRSRTGNISAPNSPLLPPQSDAPLKPLTGSIRSSPRVSAQEAAPPFENLVLPTFRDTFFRAPRSFPPKKSKLTKAVSVVSAYLFSVPVVEERRGIEMRREDPAEKLPKSLEIMGAEVRLDKVRRVVTIGVHGWFPNPMLKPVFGEPTGTSVKFATMMHDAVQTYLESSDVGSFNIQAIALEGEGQVQVRVDKLYQQLLGREEWVQALRKADVVFLATHSQGSVVSTHLLERMIKDGLVTGDKIHMLAMCAIAQGPFVYLNQSYALTPYFNYLESAAARELFEFQDSESVVTINFLESLRSILASGVKVTTVGSINDQVVPLYSALFSGIAHPAILRAVYIDSAAFRTSDFLANLVIFATRLRNAGLHDHDLTYHVSEVLAGALTGVGHSKIYEEPEVFNLAVRYAFETTALSDAPTHLSTFIPGPKLAMSFSPRERRNPYSLTFALRGMIEDPQVRELFKDELTALREAFETWKPATKFKDVKLKLEEGIRRLPRAKEGKL